VTVLIERALNRATLARQLLLERSTTGVFDAVEHLVGLQAQVPHNPYLALWSRLEGFEPEELSQLLDNRRVVRIVVMRGTLHLVSAEDALVLRALAQPVLDQEMARHGEFAASLRGRDLAPAMAFARGLLAEAPRTGGELRAAMAERFPEEDAAAFAFACRNLLGLVQVPPRGLWRRSGIVRSTTVEAWLGRPLAAAPSIDDVVVRYLAAFGPATVADVATWSRLTGLREVLERLRPRLAVFRDERGRELFDVPDGPRPDPDTPAPVRFLPEYDNLLLSHADRSRFLSDDERRQLSAGTRAVKGSVLHDGRGIGTWRMDGDALVVDHLVPLAKRAAAAIEAEGRRALAFLEPAGSDVRLVALP
jgi:hypothetical protein